MTRQKLDELFEKYFEGKKSIGVEGMSAEDKEKAVAHQYMQQSVPR